MLPDIWLCCMSILVTVVERLTIECGSTPPNLLEPISSASNLLQFVRRVTKSRSLIVPPPKLLSFKLSQFRFRRLPKSILTFPLKELSNSSSPLRFETLDSECGRVPVRLFCPTFRYARFGRLKPMSTGRLPSNLLNAKEIV
ncbi:hypothetical protein CISIN_1g032428mg [Citrus sinensis]|uniref:Secreted protein n=1 Tax=Citrus sinensis TaxID=2711 RepID=A0A067DXF9_CITSI|nr:hypothetical protein CISIN_1g032428mg [Citrus sinensis]